jgi:dihydroflavonol-4-reductase
LRKAFGDWFENLELVEADLLDADSISRAVAGSTYVVHTASPVVFNPKTDDDVIKPAVDGTLAVMKACT